MFAAILLSCLATSLVAVLSNELGASPVPCRNHGPCYDTSLPYAVYVAHRYGKAKFGKYGCMCIDGTCRIEVLINGATIRPSCVHCGNLCKTTAYYRYLDKNGGGSEGFGPGTEINPGPKEDPETTPEAEIVTERPVAVTEGPVEATEEPVETTEEPVKVTEEPFEATEEPVDATEGPDEVTEGPVEVTEDGFGETDYETGSTELPQSPHEEATDTVTLPTDNPVIKESQTTDPATEAPITDVPEVGTTDEGVEYPEPDYYPEEEVE